MTDRYQLNETRSPIDPSSWSELNENWDLIKSYLRFLERQIKFLAGGNEIDDILLRIDTAIANAENATADVQQAKQEIETILADLSVLVAEAENATDKANTAASNANTLNGTLTALKGELETLQGNLNGVVHAETQRVSEETARRENEAARVLKEQARESAEQQRNTTFNSKMTDAEQKTATMQSLIQNLVSYNYTPGATYNFPNLIKYNGSTFIALKSVTGITPTDDGVNYRLVAEKGVKGDTGAGVNIIGQFDNPSELPASGNVGDAYLIGGNLYIWGGSAWVDGGNIKGPKGDTATGIKVLDYTINATDTTQVTLSNGAAINPTDYAYNADTDTIDVYRNSRILYPGLDFTIEDGTIRVIQPVAEPDKTTFYIRVTRVVYRIDEDAGRETVINALGYTPVSEMKMIEDDDVQIQTFEDYRNIKETISFPENKGLVSIRFDDNDYTFHQNAYPILKSRGLVATNSFVTNRIGAFPTRQKCTDAQIIEMCKYGFELASHTYTHNRTPLNDEEIGKEIIQSKLDWENATNFKVRNLVAPGTWDNPLPKRNSNLGKIISKHYTFFEGDDTHPIPNRPLNSRYSINHQTGDGQTAAKIKSWINEVSGVPKSLIILFHSVGDIITGEGGVTYGVDIPTFTEVCDYLKSLRDQGLIEICTDSGVMGAAVNAEKNFLYNGDFEVLNANNMPVNFNIINTPTIIGTDSKKGVNNLRTTNTNYVTSFVSCYGMKSPIFKFSAWHKTDTGGVARLMVNLGSGGVLSWTSASTTEWRKIEGCFSTPLNENRIGLFLQPTSGVVFWDDVKLTRIG